MRVRCVVGCGRVRSMLRMTRLISPVGRCNKLLQAVGPGLGAFTIGRGLGHLGTSCFVYSI